jgi:hypothetical protein
MTPIILDNQLEGSDFIWFVASFSMIIDRYLRLVL